MRRILFPTDFSDAAKSALKYTLKFAKDYDCSVHLFHAYRQFAATNAPVVVIPAVHHKGEYAKNYMKSFIDEIVEETPGAMDELSMDYELVLGLASDEIIEISKDGEYDLIAMGKTGESNLADKILGSVTTAAISRAKCPVLAIPENSNYMGIDKILYATDETAVDHEILKEIMEFASHFKASIYFVHVSTKPEDEAVLEDKLFQQIFESKENPPVPFEIVTISGESVEEALNDFVEQKEIDLLVMVREHKNLWKKIFSKSQTRKMTFNSKVPLLVLHPGDKIDL